MLKIMAIGKKDNAYCIGCGRYRKKEQGLVSVRSVYGLVTSEVRTEM
jgi:hypothetical protein